MHNKGKALIGKLFKTVLSCFIVLCTCFTLLPSSAVQSKTLYQEEPVQTTNEDQTQNEQPVVEEEPSTNTEDSSTQNEPSTNNEEQTTQPSEQTEDETEDESNEEEQQESTQVTSEGFDLTTDANKISSIDWYYIKDGHETKIDVAGNTEIPGDASIKISVSYQGIQIGYLKTNYNRTLLFDLPDILRNAVAQGSVMSGSTKVGDVTIDNRKVKVQFNEDYLNGLISGERQQLMVISMLLERLI